MILSAFILYVLTDLLTKIHPGFTPHAWTIYATIITATTIKITKDTLEEYR